jgi:hypothetical protein
MIRMPPRPTQAGAFFDWCRGIHDVLQSLIALKGNNTHYKQTPRGTYLDAQPKRGGGSSMPTKATWLP